MATYKEIKGVTVQTRDIDPVINAGTWSTGGSLNTGRQSPYSNGTQSAAWCAAGYTTTNVALNEHYNGTAWSEQGDMNAARQGGTGGAGTTTAGLVAGGDQFPSPRQIALTETWDGSSWTEVNDLNTARAGSQIVGQAYTAALIGGGLTNNGNDYNANTETWNGSSWTETGDLNTARWGMQGAGTNTAASFSGGTSGSNVANLEQFDGSSWTETTDSNNSRRLGSSSVGSPYNDFIVFGGYIGNPESITTTTESWNGTAWTELNDLGTAESNLGGAGTSSAGLSFAGTPQISQTEEFSFPPPTAVILNEGDLFLSGGTTLKGFGKAGGIPSTSWASGGSLNAGRYRVSASNTGGTVSASIIFGGYAPSSAPPNNYFASTESYDGTSFTEVNDLNLARSSASGFGSSTSAIMAAGNQSPKAQTEVWNGTSWTEVNDINTGRSQLAGGGISGTAGLIFGGSLPGYSMQSKTETWDGTSWTETGDLNLARDELAGSGVQTAAFAVAGKVKESGGPPTWYQSNTHEQWDGSSNKNRILEWLKLDRAK